MMPPLKIPKDSFPFPVNSTSIESVPEEMMAEITSYLPKNLQNIARVSKKWRNLALEVKGKIETRYKNDFISLIKKYLSPDQLSSYKKLTDSQNCSDLQKLKESSEHLKSWFLEIMLTFPTPQLQKFSIQYQKLLSVHQEDPIDVTLRSAIKIQNTIFTYANRPHLMNEMLANEASFNHFCAPDVIRYFINRDNLNFLMTVFTGLPEAQKPQIFIKIINFIDCENDPNFHHLMVGIGKTVDKRKRCQMLQKLLEVLNDVSKKKEVQLILKKEEGQVSSSPIEDYKKYQSPAKVPVVAGGSRSISF